MNAVVALAVVLAFVLALGLLLLLRHRSVAAWEWTSDGARGVSSRSERGLDSGSPRAVDLPDSRMAHPPTCDWVASDHYACFLSHYKVEAGETARYLTDLLQRMLGCPVYLDR